MTTQRASQIIIPKPCHENWNAMSAEERGRFCKVCSKTVLDFTDKSQEHIEEFISQHSNEKLCGRFRSDQLHQPVEIQIPYLLLYNKLQPYRAFIAALFFAFSTTLFSCTYRQGELIKISDDSQSADSIAVDDRNGMIKGDTTMVVGQMICWKLPESDSAQSDNFMPVKTNRPDDGEIIIDTLPATDIVGNSITELYVLGGISSVINYCQINSEETKIDTPENKNASEQIEDNFNQLVFPNPTNGIFNLKMKTSPGENVRTDLFDLTGKFVRNIFSSASAESFERTETVDISDLPDGIYMLSTIIGDKIKFEKIILQK